ncbi:MAG: hypothetical protein H7066_18235 [Cytophagaceae bacterium]|nr:hypothetical protein [Gemmatimonadaceae bacterium]
MRHINYAAGALLLAVTIACSKKEEAAVADSAAAAPMTPPAAVANVSILELGRGIGPNMRVTDTTSMFKAGDTIYLAVVTENAAQGSMLTAKWTFQDGQVVDSTSQPVAPPSATEPVSVTEFHVSKPGGWPAGKYTVEVMLDGASKGSKTFDVGR